MKLWDMLKLVGHEYKYGKKEWIISTILQCLIFTGMFFLFTIAGDMDKICGEYISPLYPDGFEFRLSGYSETDVSELEKMGLYNISISSATNQGYGVTDSLSRIWIYKLYSVFIGKDIWSTELDEVLGVIFLCQISFGGLGIGLFLIMLNNLSNSYAMKLMRRKEYIIMLGQLGCPKYICQSIYYFFFGFRSLLALLSAVCLNGALMHLLNGYLVQNMFIQASFSKFHWTQAMEVYILSMLFMWLCFQRHWRYRNEC